MEYKRALIFESDTSLIFIYESMRDDLRPSITITSSTEDTLEKISQENFDLLLLDNNFSGIEEETLFLEKIRNKYHGDIIIIDGRISKSLDYEKWKIRDIFEKPDHILKLINFFELDVKV